MDMTPKSNYPENSFQLFWQRPTEMHRWMGWFRRLMPREDRFFDLFQRHAETLVAGAEALHRLLAGDDVEARGKEIMALEANADVITSEVMLAVRRSFITPFDRGDIKDLIQSMDDAIDMMRKTVKTVTLFEQASFDPLMQEMGAVIVDAAKLTAEAVPLLQRASANARRLNELTEEIARAEERSDELYDRGLKELFVKHGRSDTMAYLIGSEIYGELEKVVDRLEDVANEISGIVLENV
jgi:predicted phosphate transport protein (TIGR00153 family)